MAKSPRAVEWSVRAYRVLLRAYPASFREEYAGEMTQVFRDVSTDAWRRRGAPGLMTAWLRVLGDLAVTAIGEHVAELQRRPTMKTALAIVGSALLAVVFSLFVSACMMMTLGVIMSAAIGWSPIVELAVIYFTAFLAGMILARVKPLFRPKITAPLGVMIHWGCVGALNGDAPWWMMVGFVASVGLAIFAGVAVGARASRFLGRFAMPLSHSVGALAVLLCTSNVTWLLWCLLESKQLDSEMAPVLNASLLSLLLIAAITIASVVRHAARGRQDAQPN